jgi:hypothetical protein
MAKWICRNCDKEPHQNDILSNGTVNETHAKCFGKIAYTIAIYKYGKMYSREQLLGIIAELENDDNKYYSNKLIYHNYRRISDAEAQMLQQQSTTTTTTTAT